MEHLLNRHHTKARQLRDHLLKQMEESQIPIGGRLPSEAELVRRFSISRSTVRQVLSELCVAGHIERQQGRGTFRTGSWEDRKRRRSQRSLLVGVWFNWPARPLYGPIAAGVRDELGHWGYHAVFEAGCLEVGAERRGIESLIAKDLDGFIVAPASNSRDEHKPLIELIERQVPIVLVDSPIEGHETDLVCADHEWGAEEVVSHLIELGHRRIAFVGVERLYAMRDRLAGYQRTMERHGLPVDPAWIQVNEHVEADTGRKAALALLSLAPGRRPTAVFGANDYIAETFVKVARGLGFAVPDDVSVAGFDDTRITPTNPVWLTTYAQPKYHIGQRAARLLMNRLNSPTKRTMTILLQGTLMKRTSTAPPQGAEKGDTVSAAGSAAMQSQAG